MFRGSKLKEEERKKNVPQSPMNQNKGSPKNLNGSFEAHENVSLFLMYRKPEVAFSSSTKITTA
jgi:hypothetical protein